MPRKTHLYWIPLKQQTESLILGIEEMERNGIIKKTKGKESTKGNEINYGKTHIKDR